jgi:hypothetical protein
MALTVGQYVKATDGTHVETDGVKRYVTLLSQSGTDAPVATVLENSLGGTVVWSRDASGRYTGTLAGVFTANKTVGNSGAVAGSGTIYDVKRGSDNTVFLSVNSAALESAQDFEGDTIPVEIRVYP